MELGNIKWQKNWINKMDKLRKTMAQSMSTKKSIFLTTTRFENKFYRKIMIL